MNQLKIKISENIRVSGNYFRLKFRSEQLSKTARPGQFIELKVTDGLEPLLRKPLGIHRIISPNMVEVLYEVIGKGTEALSKRSPGEVLDVIGPLGNGFDLGSRVEGPGSRVLVAGGIGAAPLVFLAQKLRPLSAKPPEGTIDHRPSTLGRPLVLIGAKTKDALLCEKEFKDLGCNVSIVTEDGSKGHKGFVTDLLKKVLNTQYSILNTIYTCGPKSMLKAVAHISTKYRTPCQLLLEEYMACGVGVCLGCPIKVKTQYPCLAGRQAILNTQYQYKMVCKDGPVFRADEVIWE
ncbi:MAG: dihydroorotate dehydrogenase electron transfer subunit [Candidatus Omnitrophica bacterium]|nr:dihydroorotate dehydrogenase electron transfer subunit [Candidatus Omnitrophota bacterium]